MAGAANAGRKAAPPNLRILAGQGTRKDGRATDSGGRPIEPTPDFNRAAPAKPADLSADAEWLWDRIVEQMAGRGLLKPLDASSLEVLCETFARWREAVRWRKDHALLAKNSQGTVAAPWIGIEERAGREFRAWCAEYGITPAAEKNLKAESEGAEDDNPF